MKDAVMDIEWRTVQLFISDEFEISEVEIDAENNNKIRCTCRVFMTRATCKHQKYVKRQMIENDGHYSVRIPTEVDDEEAIEAMKDAAKFRDFVIKYGVVEVL